MLAKPAKGSARKAARAARREDRAGRACGEAGGQGAGRLAVPALWLHVERLAGGSCPSRR